MPQSQLGVIFSDLDGTFLDGAYRPALDGDAAAELFERWCVVWASSRTDAELRFVQERVGHTGDAIAENGGVIVTRDLDLARAIGTPEAADSTWVVQLASPGAVTEDRVHRAFSAESITAPTMAALGPVEIARRSGYSLADADRAMNRRASVLLTDLDYGDERVERALGTLRDGGATIGVDGRWVSVVHGADKGQAAKAWLAAWSARHGSPRIVIGIGNADNDDPLLRQVDYPFVIRREDGSYPPTLLRVERARLLKRHGTAGWSEMLEAAERIAADAE